MRRASPLPAAVASAGAGGAPTGASQVNLSGVRACVYLAILLQRGGGFTTGQTFDVFQPFIEAAGRAMNSTA